MEFDGTLRLAATIMTAHSEPLLEPMLIPRDDDNTTTSTPKRRKVSPRHDSHSSPSSGGDDDVDDVDAFVVARNNATRKAPLPAAHELKHLRQEAMALEHELKRLCTKWKTHLPQERVLLRACQAAKEKSLTMHVERINAELKEQLLQQQLFFSSLQSNLSESPLWNSNQTCLGIFHDVHHELRLPEADDDVRAAALRARYDAARRDAVKTMDAYTRDVIRTTTPAIPFSQTGTCGTAKYTFISNIFVAKIPNATLRAVFDATVDHFSNLREQLDRHLAMKLTSLPICSLGESFHYTQLEYTSGAFTGALSNVTYQAEILNDDLAIVVVDFVDDDARYPPDATENALRKDGLSLIVLTPVVDELTGQNCILLRRLLVHRYNLLSNSSRLHTEVQSMVSYFNGDLSMAMLCEALQSNAKKTSTDN